MNKRWKKMLAACTVASLLSVMTPTLAVHATAVTVAPANLVMYTNENTSIYTTADLQGQIVIVLPANQPVNVTGITSNGWFQVTAAGAIYYVQGSGLHAHASAGTTSSTATISTNQKIEQMIKGTFSFYSKVDLDGFSKGDVEDMSVNEYIKYLDSYLAGKSNVGNAILRDTGLTAQKEFETKQVLHAVMTAANVTEYLMEYRQQYLLDSFWGPVDTVADVKVCINRAIRYDISSFTVVCHEYEIGNSETSMNSRVEKMLQQVKDEQGITFTSTQSYGTFTDQNGNSASGWIMEITRAS